MINLKLVSLMIALFFMFNNSYAASLTSIFNFPKTMGKIYNHINIPTDTFRLEFQIECFYWKDREGLPQPCGDHVRKIRIDANGTFEIPKIRKTFYPPIKHVPTFRVSVIFRSHLIEDFLILLDKEPADDDIDIDWIREKLHENSVYFFMPTKVDIKLKREESFDNFFARFHSVDLRYTISIGESRFVLTLYEKTVTKLNYQDVFIPEKFILLPGNTGDDASFNHRLRIDLVNYDFDFRKSFKLLIKRKYSSTWPNQISQTEIDNSVSLGDYLNNLNWTVKANGIWKYDDREGSRGVVKVENLEVRCVKGYLEGNLNFRFRDFTKSATVLSGTCGERNGDFKTKIPFDISNVLTKDTTLTIRIDRVEYPTHNWVLIKKPPLLKKAVGSLWLEPIISK